MITNTIIANASEAFNECPSEDAYKALIEALKEYNDPKEVDTCLLFARTFMGADLFHAIIEDNTLGVL